MDIFLYAFSVMYSPGPVNLMGLNAGLTGKFRRSMGFFAGVGCAMLVLFILFGYTGEAVISHAALPYISLVGACIRCIWPIRFLPPGRWCRRRVKPRHRRKP